jgi:proteic killer suppression protein
MPPATGCNLRRYIRLDPGRNAWHDSAVEIRSIRHKALRKFAETGNPKGVIEPERLKRMLAFLVQAQAVDELAVPPNFGFHALTGDRHGSFAMTVTRNWRLTFTLIDDVTVADLDLEDYH